MCFLLSVFDIIFLPLYVCLLLFVAVAIFLAGGGSDGPGQA